MAHPSEPISFGLFDKDAEVEQSERYLPHWFQPGVATFVTFRTADSLPRAVVAQWQEEQRRWLRQHGIRISADGPLPEAEALPATIRSTFRQHRERRRHWHLDRCHGECLLRRPEIATIVGEALRHFDGDRYDLDCLVVMPNHVHVLAQFRHPVTCRQQCASWLRYTAVRINREIGRRGAFWQSEPFDHLVRSAEQFRYLQQYIAENPTKANLRPGEYLFWKR